MSESRDRRTEPPTERRLEKAREEGEIPFSNDVSAATVLIVILAAMWLLRDPIAQHLAVLGHYALDSPQRIRGQTSSAVGVESSMTVMGLILMISLPLALVAVVGAVLVNLWQTGVLVAFKAASPRFERVNPADGWRNLFSRRSLVELVKSILKMLMIGVTLFILIRWALQSVVKLPSQPIGSVTAVIAILFAFYFVAAAAILALIAIADLQLQRLLFLREQRMTPEEVKRDRREELGDPHLRAERRRRSAEIAGESLFERAGRSSVIIRAGGEGVAVALFVEPVTPPVVWLVHKGGEQVADIIVAMGRKGQVPVVEDERLATAIFNEVAIDANLPPRLAERAVAAVSR